MPQIRITQGIYKETSLSLFYFVKSGRTESRPLTAGVDFGPGTNFVGYL